jgi:hypothetical protein
MVGRSGSSAEVLPSGVVDAVLVVSLPEEVVSGVRRFMVGRSGSSAGFELVSVGVLDVVVDVPEDVPELDGSELDGSEVRRFMVGRSGSALVDVLVVLDAVVSGLLVDWGAVLAGVGFVWSLPLEDAVSPGFEPK